MAVLVDSSGARPRFHLRSPSSSYAFEVIEGGVLAHSYWGPALRSASFPERIVPRGRAQTHLPSDLVGSGLSPEWIPLECPVGNVDARPAMLRVESAEGAFAIDPRYRSHRVVKGKPGLEGLPSFFAEGEGDCETLVLELFDAPTGLVVELAYAVFAKHEGLLRSLRVRNDGGKPLILRRAFSFCLDLPEDGLDVLCLPGAWGREREVARQPLRGGTFSAESRRGSSSHQMSPFLALLTPDANEVNGRVYAAQLVYSGGHQMAASVDAYHTTRFQGGVQPDEFAWTLEPGASFQAPEAVLVFSDAGLSGMSLAFHRLAKDRLLRGKHRHGRRPVLLNNWEATYFKFDEEKLVAIASAAAPLGVEMLVLDDGWFGAREHDKAGLGDWIVNRAKLPSGLDGLVRRVNEKGLRFGLWVEPEMVNPDSDLYRRHPEWALSVPGRPPALGRNQLVLDWSRKDVQDWAIDTFSAVFSSAKIEYVKWDFNRQLSDVFSSALPAGVRQGEVRHRYVLGLYRVLEALTARFPDILFEGCSGGGGRFDLAMLAYMPQTWTSDNSDAVSRLKIQHGTSLLMPPLSVVTHVSAVPNHQAGRSPSMTFRHHVAFFGNMGYELDAGSLSPEEAAEVKGHIAFYRSVRHLVEQGDFHRLLSPWDGGDTAWILVSPDRREALAGWFRPLAEVNEPVTRVKLRGLDPALDYLVGEARWGGDQLMHAGLPVPPKSGDAVSRIWHLKAAPGN